MLRIKNNLLFCIIALSMLSCSYIHVVNKEPVFTNFKPESKEYRNKLAEIIRSNPDDLTYVFEKYAHTQNSDYLKVKVYGNDIAATARVMIGANQNGIEGLIAHKGKSYQGAELYGLELDVVDSPTGALFIFKEVGFIID